MGEICSAISVDRLRRFHDGTEQRAWEWLGAHREVRNGQEGVVFRLWAPHAADVSVINEKNGWLRSFAPMTRLEADPEIWECFLTDMERFDCYKYSIRTKEGAVFDKADPFAFYAETRPYNASKYYSMSGYEWHDREWMRQEKPEAEPVNIYEVHLGSWKVREDSSFYSYRELADQLIPYVRDMGYTYLELLPLMEHPFDGSWGYQPLGWFAATSRYGTPRDLMYFIDRCHQAGLGVILDWTAAGFPSDAHGLICFDGEPCYECQPPENAMPFGMQRFDLAKGEVVSFLLSSAMFWVSQFHLDGLRVSSVQPMLFLDYQRGAGSWKANQYGENQNLEGAAFLRQLCDTMQQAYPNVRIIASSTGMWPSVTKPTRLGGLGFSNMWRDEWICEVLEQLKSLEDADAFADWLSLSLLNSMGERYVLPVSHDLVSHGAGSMLSRMPGAYHEKFARLRLLYGFVMAHPGDKLLFMGSEFAQFTEWACHHGLDWMVLDYEAHRQIHAYVRGMNLFYRGASPLWEWENKTGGFIWLDRGLEAPGILSFERRSPSGERILAVINFTGQDVSGYQLILDTSAGWEVAFSSDQISYGGTGAERVSCTGTEDGTCCLTLRVPAFSIRFLRPVSQSLFL
ncbi:MAG: 1,4-alpha-glucan branching protein GlgB [Eubacteriales bacterium]|nr:1,4-alpha-glucan branching protein GlgB [Eubacteriales bacterium]